jgi:hypothetical protein
VAERATLGAVFGPLSTAPNPPRFNPFSFVWGPDLSVKLISVPDKLFSVPDQINERGLDYDARLRRAIGAKLPNPPNLPKPPKPPKPSKFTTPKIHQFATEFRAFYIVVSA